MSHQTSYSWQKMCLKSHKSARNTKNGQKMPKSAEKFEKVGISYYLYYHPHMPSEPIYQSANLSTLQCVIQFFFFLNFSICHSKNLKICNFVNTIKSVVPPRLSYQILFSKSPTDKSADCCIWQISSDEPPSSSACCIWQICFDGTPSTSPHEEVERQGGGYTGRGEVGREEERKNFWEKT